MRSAKFVGYLMVALALIAPLTASYAQDDNNDVSESGRPIKTKPRDGIYTSKVKERIPIGHNHIEERDVMWEKRIWREIDIKEQRNHHFAYEKRHFINILLEAAKKGDIRAFSSMDDEFSQCLSVEDLDEKLATRDAVTILNPETGLFEDVAVENEFNPATVTRYRIKEVSYFDSRLGRMNTRILGIAPIVNRYDDNGNFINSMPLCWFYYDDMRPVLATEPVFSAQSDMQQMTWDDIFEARVFASYITKESNVRDLRLQDIHSGIAILHESDKVKETMRNYEHDLFDY